MLKELQTISSYISLVISSIFFRPNSDFFERKVYNIKLGCCQSAMPRREIKVIIYRRAGKLLLIRSRQQQTDKAASVGYSATTTTTTTTGQSSSYFHTNNTILFNSRFEEKQGIIFKLHVYIYQSSRNVAWNNNQSSKEILGRGSKFRVIFRVCSSQYHELIRKKSPKRWIMEKWQMWNNRYIIARRPTTTLPPLENTKKKKNIKETTGKELQRVSPRDSQ